MSDHPMQEIDAEITGVISKISTSTNQIMMHLGRGRGTAAPGDGGGRGRTRGVGPGLRQTRPPSRRQLARMTNGQLTSYMVKTHMRGLGGQPVDAEAHRLGGEFRRRGLDQAADGWAALGTVRARHLAQVAERQHAVDTADPALTTTALLDEHGLDPDQAVKQVRRERYQDTAALRRADAARLAGSLTAGAAEAAEYPDQQPEPQVRAVDDPSVGIRAGVDNQEVAEEVRRRSLRGPDRAEGDVAGWMSPAVATALEAVTVSAGFSAFETLAESIDAFGAEVGVDPVPAAGLDEAGSEASDLAADGAPSSAVEAAEFGSGAVTGQLGQALADQTNPGSGADRDLDAGHDQHADLHAEAGTGQAAGAEV
ncbi:hypothetical protein [Corynebacterium bovis]|uniref:hypothetical protein n=1 Tax=Corynebacterium bovis TaxID=36808 RepID=UPI000F63C3E1|nr:hypothetical protein [Corynebacterium bovis]RRO90226.1 hypothetical protein CXF30_01050 [Corynebacterium bovis]